MRSFTALMAFSAIAVSAGILSACAMNADEDAESRFAPVAAGQAIRLEQKNAPVAGSTYRMAYRSTDAHNPTHLVAVSSEVMIPRGAPPAGGWPVLAWAHGTSGIGLTCAPSVMGIGGPQASFYSRWLRRGYAIVATDYPGLGEPGAALYLNAKSEGMAVLDSVRAARRRFSSLSGHVVLLGHDQGAQAVLAASALANSYAPSLQIKGTIALGAPYFDSNSGHILNQPRGARRFAPGVVYGLLLGASLGSADPGFDASRAFKPRALPYYRKATELCRGDFFGAVEHAGLTPDNTFQPDAEQALAPALDWARYPSLALTSPVMLGIASNDSQIPPAQQEKLKQDLCAAGTVVSVHHYRVEHSPLLNAAESEAQNFADRSLQGDAISSDCQ